MKFLVTLLFSLSLFHSSFSQNRKEILREVDSYKNRIVKDASYNVTKDSLKNVLSTYFIQHDYTLDSASIDGVVFYIRLLCHGEQQFLDNNTKKRNTVYRIFYISIVYSEGKDKTLFPQFETSLIDSYTSAYEYNQAVLSLGTSSIAVSGKTTNCFCRGKIFRFNKMDVKRFLYVHFNGLTIPLSKDLMVKIENYNVGETKEKKKIIAGRDY